MACHQDFHAELLSASSFNALILFTVEVILDFTAAQAFLITSGSVDCKVSSYILVSTWSDFSLSNSSTAGLGACCMFNSWHLLQVSSTAGLGTCCTFHGWHLLQVQLYHLWFCRLEGFFSRCYRFVGILDFTKDFLTLVINSPDCRAGFGLASLLQGGHLLHVVKCTIGTGGTTFPQP